MSATVTIKCGICPSMVRGTDALQVLKESDFHLQTAHPEMTGDTA